MVRKGLVALILGATAAGLAGCGGGGAREQARAVTERFYAAVQRGDGTLACAQLSPDTRSQLESEEGKPCPEAISSLDLRPGRVTRVQVYITNAKADLASGDSAFLDEGPQGWQLSAVGCAPANGKPADEPAECALEA